MEIARHWRLKQQRLNLVGEKCPKGHHVFPPRDICPDCGHEAKDLHQFSGKGEVYSSTVVYRAPNGHTGPYQMALVDLAEGPRVTAQLTDLADPTKLVPIGSRVEMVTRKLQNNEDRRGVIVYGYKFRLASATEASTSSI